MAPLTKQNRKKYSFTCIAPNALGLNKDWNKTVEESCKRSKKDLYQPSIEECLDCQWLKIKGLK